MPLIRSGLRHEDTKERRRKTCFHVFVILRLANCFWKSFSSSFFFVFLRVLRVFVAKVWAPFSQFPRSIPRVDRAEDISPRRRGCPRARLSGTGSSRY